MKKERFSFVLTFGICFFASCTLALADYPTKPINIIFGFQPGGGMDATGRTLANDASKMLGQPMVCSNQPGAGGNLSLGRLKGERPDGYMIANATTGAFCRAPYMMPIPFAPLKDFTYIMQYGAFQYGIGVRSDSPWKTFEEFIDYAKKNPGKITYGTAGVGLGQHLAMEFLAMHYGIQWNHVPFTGSPHTALLGGHVNAIAATAEFAEFVHSGRILLLVSLGYKRWKAFPNVPTLLEKGIPFATHSGICFVGPAGMEKPVVEKLQNAFHKAMETKVFEDVCDRFQILPYYLDSEALKEFVHKDNKETGEIIKKLGLGIYKK